MRHFLLSITCLCASLAAQDPTAQPPILPVVTPPYPAPFTQPQSPQSPPSSVNIKSTGPVEEGTPTVSFDRPLVLEPKIRDITTLHNSMPQSLVGIGLVVGLPGTGSTDRGSRMALLNFIQREGLNFTIADVVGGATALVTLTAELPTFAKEGDTIDVKCAALGVVTSLRYGVLIRAELHAVNGDTYALAQGALAVNGIQGEGANAKITKGSTTTGWLTNGGQVVKNLESSFWSDSGCLELRLLNPSPANASSIANGIRSVLTDFGLTVTAVDPALVRIPVADGQRTSDMALKILGLIGEVRVKVDNPATVVIDQSSGTVIAGEGVMISPCVVGLEEITVAVMNDDDISQPNPFGNGETARTGRTRIDVQSESKGLKPMTGGATVGDLLANLKSLGMTPSQLVAVFTALDHGHFLQARLELR